MEKIPMTAAGHSALESELKRRTSQERPRIIEAIAEARGHGDLSENAEYHAAKEAHGLNEGRILEIEDQLSRAEIIDVSKLSGKTVRVIHIVGGGSQNALLCQLTADRSGLPVIAGPVEATALGNVLVQARAAGELGSLADARAVVRESFPVDEFAPRADPRWASAAERFDRVVAGPAAG